MSDEFDIEAWFCASVDLAKARLKLVSLGSAAHGQHVFRVLDRETGAVWEFLAEQIRKPA